MKLTSRPTPSTPVEDIDLLITRYLDKRGKLREENNAQLEEISCLEQRVVALAEQCGRLYEQLAGRHALAEHARLPWERFEAASPEQKVQLVVQVIRDLKVPIADLDAALAGGV